MNCANIFPGVAYMISQILSISVIYCTLKELTQTRENNGPAALEFSFPERRNISDELSDMFQFLVNKV